RAHRRAPVRPPARQRGPRSAAEGRAHARTTRGSPFGRGRVNGVLEYPRSESDMSDPRISLAYSVDADDAFMFHALREGRIDTEGLSFTHRRDHTAALNRLAAEGGADVVAVSLGAYPALAEAYRLLPHGASVGRGFGPVVVARRPM